MIFITLSITPESKLLFVSDNIWENLDEENFITLQAVFSLTDYRLVLLLNQPAPTLLEENESREKLSLRFIRPNYRKRHIEDPFGHKYPYGFQ